MSILRGWIYAKISKIYICTKKFIKENRNCILSKKDTKFLWELSGDTLVPRKFAVGRDYTTSKKMFNDYNDTKSRGKFEPRTEKVTSDSNTMLKALPTNVFAMDIIMPWIRKYVTKQPEGKQKWDKSEYDD